jgi:hypothetical protein
MPPANDFVRATAMVWLICMLAIPAVPLLGNIVQPAFNAPVAMAAYLDEHIPQTVLIETWEPEMGFLTNHNYHFPPPELLDKAVGYIWRNGTAPAENYELPTKELPKYILVGGFSRWVHLYSDELLTTHYQLNTTIGTYELYSLH